jgi:hypothetical protein
MSTGESFLHGGIQLHISALYALSCQTPILPVPLLLSHGNETYKLKGKSKQTNIHARNNNKTKEEKQHRKTQMETCRV